MLPFKRGFERIVDGLDVPIVPVYLDRVWGSIFSFKGGRFFWKWPVRVPYPVTVAFGAPLPSTTTAAEARLALQTLGCDLAMQRRPADESLGASIRPDREASVVVVLDGRRHHEAADVRPRAGGGAAAVALGAAPAAGRVERRPAAARRRSAARWPTSGCRWRARCR